MSLHSMRRRGLATLLRQGVKGGLVDVALIEIGSVVAVSTIHA
jgi:hypothetical protein